QDPGDHLGARHLELVSLATHRLDQDREVQLTAARDSEDIWLVGGLDTQRKIRLELPLQALAELPRGRVLPVLTSERGRRDAERELEGGLVDMDLRHRLRMLGMRDGGADLHAGEAG